jgi:trehalose synthase
MALDDPEGWEIYGRLLKEREKDPLIHVFTNLTGVSNMEVNAFQRLSDIVVQKSLREGFGLVVSEALWKYTPVVAGRAGGIPLQVGEGEGGVLVDDVAGCATAITDLLQKPDKGRALASRGHDLVREQFLLPRLMLDELELMHQLADGARRASPPRRRERPPR